MSVITIVGAGMMGSALAFPARENGNEVRLVGTHLDREIIDTARQTGRHREGGGQKAHPPHQLSGALSALFHMVSASFPH